jgi:DNA-directed RNA polymerase subunit RPC12/RpoP/ribosomal protein S16
MQINIKGRVYRVEIASKPIRRDGVEVEALFQYGSRRIQLSPTLAPADRYRAVMHECLHAWRAEGAKPGDEEEECLDVAAFSDTVSEQIETQGGRPALIAMQPPAAVERRAAMERGDDTFAASSYDCARCGATTMSGSVETSALQSLKFARITYVDRHFVCDACGSRNAWAERCNDEGLPLGVMLPGRKYQLS